MIEIWKPVHGFEGLYEVSDQGRVQSVDRIEVCKNGQIRNRPGILLKQPYLKFKGKRTYHYVNLSKDGIIDKRTVHRLVAIHHVENPKNLPEVNHLYGDKEDNRACSLVWTTGSENTVHALDNGLRKGRASTNTKAKLSDKDVRQIRARYIAGRNTNAKQLAMEFGVGRTAIYKIISGTTWVSPQP